MIEYRDDVFTLNTQNTSYIFRKTKHGQLEHLYFGSRVNVVNPDFLMEEHTYAPGNTSCYDDSMPELSLECMGFEMSTIGKGDIREPMLEAISADGSSTLDFVYKSHEILKGKEKFSTLPGSYGTVDEVETLNVTLQDKNHGYQLILSYYVFEKCDCITRAARFVNCSNEPVKLTRMLSMLMDIDQVDLKITSLHGSWTNEMNKKEIVLTGGKLVNSSFTGTSSNRCNPFFMISSQETSEENGDAYAFNLIYSGNHYSASEVSYVNKTRVVMGINPMNFAFFLNKDEIFEAPEVVMSYSKDGFTGVSRNMHDFVRNHIVRGPWKYKERPVLLNSWEAEYFDFNEESLVKLAAKAKEVGCELFVLDDGWYGDRSSGDRSLGDWDIINKNKLPNGLEGLSKKINNLGLKFGIWVEPEMVNVNSNLYRKHPEWTIDIPGMKHSEGRNQRILDLCNDEVVDYVIARMEEVFSTPGLVYVKWDMNRNFTDYYSRALDTQRQQETGHRYVLGLYKILNTLRQEFPELLMEGCSAGGNRFDLGMLCYFQQIWGSDNTDSICRLSIQNGYSYGYPQSVYTAHVSSVPNHQIHRTTPLTTRFNVAAFGVLGYELNLCKLSNDEIQAIKDQIALYKKYRQTLQFGDFYRLKSDNVYVWNAVAKDKKEAVSMILVKEVKPSQLYLKLPVRGLAADKNYGITEENKRQAISIENGNVIMKNGIKIRQAFAETENESSTINIADYESRLYCLSMV